MTITLQSSIDGVVSGGAINFGDGFQTVTGGNTTAETVEDRPPGSKYPSKVPSPPNVSNVVMGRTYDEDRDGPLLSLIDAQVGSPTLFTLGRIVRRNGVRVGLRTCTGILVDRRGPEGDTNATTAKATLELEFAVSGPWA